MAPVVTQDELERILELAASQDIDISEAARRLNILDAEPTRYNCGTCRFFKAGECWQPKLPPRTERPDSVRCEAYEPRDERLESLPAESRPNDSRMWK